MKKLDQLAYKQVRAGGFGVEPSLAAKRKRNAMILIFVVAVIVAHKLLTILGLAS